MALEHDGHAGKVLDLGVADDKRVDVEAPACEDPRYPGKHPGLVLHEAVEDVGLWWGGCGQWRFVKNGRHSCRRGRPRRGVCGGQRWSRTSVQGFVGYGGRRRGGMPDWCKPGVEATYPAGGGESVEGSSQHFLGGTNGNGNGAMGQWQWQMAESNPHPQLII